MSAEKTSHPASSSSAAASDTRSGAVSGGQRPGDALLAALAPVGAKPDAIEALVGEVAKRAASLKKGAKASLSLKIHRDEKGAVTALVGASVDGKGEEPLATIELLPAPAKPAVQN